MDNLNDLKTVHIGRVIKQKLAEKSMSAGELAKRLNCTRTTVYDIFKRKSTDIEQIIRISQILECDLIHEVYFNSDKIVSVRFDMKKDQLPKLKSFLDGVQ